MKKITTLLTAILILSCAKSLEEFPASQHSESLTEFFAGDSMLIHPHLARTLAIMESGLQFREISTTPTVLYGLDANPFYYEFLILNHNGTPKGTLCTYARKEHPGVIAYILNEVREYEIIHTKAGAGYKIITEHYPHQILYGVSTKSGELSQLMDADGTPVSAQQVSTQNDISFLDTETLANIQSRLQAERNEAAAYWSQIALIETELLNLKGEYLPATKSFVTTTTKYIIAKYDTEAMQKTFWQGGCGPAALAIMYRGIYDSYNGKYLPIYGDPDFEGEGRVLFNDRAVYDYKDVDGDHDGGDGQFNMVDRDWVLMKSSLMDNNFYYDLCDFNWYYWFGNFAGSFIPSLRWGAALPWNLSGSMERITNGEYTITKKPVNTSHYIKEKQMPVVVLASNFTHYLNAYGIKEETLHWESIFKLCGKKIDILTCPMTTKKWLKVSDNGTEMQKHNYLPYWMDDNVLNTIFQFGLMKK